jgi:methylation protein EvaC
MMKAVAINLQPIIDFGNMPIAGAFLDVEQFEKEYFYHMVLGYDPVTKAVGLVHKVPIEKKFHDDYKYFSSTSQRMRTHFEEVAKKLLPWTKDGLVVEIGSNDGIMLESWKKFGVNAIGVEPSKSVATFSLSKGHDVITDFVNGMVVEQILSKGQEVSIVFGANVSSHVDNIEEYLRNITRLLGKKGIFVIEEPYFLDIVDKTSYDQIYAEHSWYFTISFINNLLEPLGYHIYNCEHLGVHGGELRMYIGYKDTHQASPVVATWLSKEKDLDQKFVLFEKNIRESKTRLLEILHNIAKEKKTICGFGAAAKSVTVFNYCGIGPELIPFVTDNTPEKHGKFYPGVHIPIVSQEMFEKGKTDTTKLVDFAFLGAWNHFKEINQSQSWYKKAGGRWINHVPFPQII